MGLAYLALRRLGLGAVDPLSLLTAASLVRGFPGLWPYLALALGIAGRRRFARDLAAPAAALGLAAALAPLARLAFLALGMARVPGLHGLAVPHPWIMLRRELAVESLAAGMCAATVYALTRPALAAACSQAGPGLRTEGLSFSGRLALARALLLVGPALAALPLPAGPGTAAAWALAALACAAMAGLWLRRPWGWLAALGQNLLLAALADRACARRAGLVWRHWRAAAPPAAPYLAAEAYCRGLAGLVAALWVLGALLKARREFRAPAAGGAG